MKNAAATQMKDFLNAVFEIVVPFEYANQKSLSTAEDVSLPSEPPVPPPYALSPLFRRLSICRNTMESDFLSFCVEQSLKRASERLEKAETDRRARAAEESSKLKEDGKEESRSLSSHTKSLRSETDGTSFCACAFAVEIF